ncbi:hypothetical protein JR065_00495 [Xanthomonas sp. AmX2]|uniref:hypothetical protein n=1 Tax=Xanthomonas sp. TaxID=29446 RepID=UPI00197F00A1|nr:hypothetical protein [Xanthomonas sp.]MBN6148804.1 hypothetical protein [Xanthomonas sp.]
MTKAQCQVCKDNFELDVRQQAFVVPLAARGQRFIMVECPRCGSSTQYVAVGDSAAPHARAANYRCPVAGCAGWVDLIGTHSPPFRGCGECGSVWQEEKDFQNAIADIVGRHPHRAGSYEKINDEWLPAGSGSEPANYEERVDRESATQDRQ